jgi:hypothetical protein
LSEPAALAETIEACGGNCQTQTEAIDRILID